MSGNMPGFTAGFSISKRPEVLELFRHNGNRISLIASGSKPPQSTLDHVHDSENQEPLEKETSKVKDYGNIEGLCV